ncbi:hypothetical protein B0A49_06293 [Cryomyces minteri]|uniref:Uncharacterized protein n=1 Tax=Cryomyces minteri TaxID=331657 RepID=A0A4U0WLR4_9PEZI|nr:hypothetical protein B0A49_06293 [Cryomyces minteri]
MPVPARGNIVIAQRFTLQTRPVAVVRFKSVGNWTWTIVHYVPAGLVQAAVASQTATFIEAYFFQGGLCDPFTYHVAELLRLVVLPLLEIRRFEDSSIALAYYAQQICRHVWNYGGPGTAGIKPLQYDCEKGVPKYIDFSPHLGVAGVYNLGRWLRRFFDTCNCYDLAGIVQLACAALGTSPVPNILSVLETEWVYSLSLGQQTHLQYMQAAIDQGRETYQMGPAVIQRPRGITEFLLD